jgi:hypothetical protein
MAQTTPEEPTLIPPASETDAKPYTPPSKKNHVPAGTAKLISVGLGLLLTLLAVVLIFSHKMSPTNHTAKLPSGHQLNSRPLPLPV